uniref:Pepsin-I3 domain-containing protein n=1 Tax=Heterorhabditis bacteriophora TaxID=37862 RepID=A0A1I7XKS5_HETBA
MRVATLLVLIGFSSSQQYGQDGNGQSVQTLQYSPIYDLNYYRNSDGSFNKQQFQDAQQHDNFSEQNTGYKIGRYNNQLNYDQKRQISNNGNNNYNNEYRSDRNLGFVSQNPIYSNNILDKRDSIHMIQQYSFNNGKCKYEDGYIIEGQQRRQANTEDMAKIRQYKQAINDYLKEINEYISIRLNAALQSIPPNQGQPNPLLPPMPAIPEVPCLCNLQSCNGLNIQNDQTAYQYQNQQLQNWNQQNQQRQSDQNLQYLEYSNNQL